MAIHCPHCDATLPRDNARFCSHCGSFVQSRPQFSMDAKLPSTPVITQEETPIASATSQAGSEPSAEVLDQGETLSPGLTESASAPEKVQELPLQDTVNDSPTQPLAVISSPPVHNVAGSNDQEDSLSFGEKKASYISEAKEYIGVSENMATQFAQSPRATPEQRENELSPVLPEVTHQEYWRPWGDVASVRETLRSVSSLPPSRPINKLHSRPRLWLVILVVVIIVGAGCWLFISQLAPNTDPWQRFTDPSLGVSVLYPADWQVEVDRKGSIVHFYDSAHIDKVDIAVSNTTTSDVAQFLQQQASQVGMSNITASPSLSFAGSSWQQVRGKLSQDGVSNSVTLLATVHRHRLYLLTQLAPQSTYNDEEALVFSAMRAGFQFS